MFSLFMCSIQSDDEELVSLEDELSSWRSATAAGSTSDSAIGTVFPVRPRELGLALYIVLNRYR